MSLADDQETAEHDDEDEDEPCEVFDVEVLECNLDSVAAFRLTQPQALATMGGVFWQGIDPLQIRAAIELLEIPRESWAEIVDDVSYMGSVVANHRNRQIKPPKGR